jgi:predicted TIM-barrel fold metal-dependent hydrolase
MIIDVHAHVFPRVRGLTRKGPTRSLGYGLVAEGNETVRVLPPYNAETAYTPEMLMANLSWAGVDKAVLLQGSFYGEWNDYAIEAVKRYPGKLCAMAYLDPWTEGCRDDLARLIELDVFNGIKLECSEASGFCGIYPDARLDDPDLEWLWQQLHKHGLTLVLDLGAVGSRSYQTSAISRIAREYPDLKIVIAHLAQPRPSVEADAEAWRQWEEQLALGHLPNIWFDCAALPAYLPQEIFPFPAAGRYLRMAIERLGPAKVMWGSDQPGLLVHASLPDLVKMTRVHLSLLSPDDQELILGGNAQEIYFRGVR